MRVACGKISPGLRCAIRAKLATHLLGWEGTMTTDIFKFWSRMKFGARVHPADQNIFARMEPLRHGFQLECLPACFAGR